MEKLPEDPIEFFKELEKELNKQIHQSTNNRTFTTAYGRALDRHLKRLKRHKRLTTRWLNQLNLANKDEIASLSVRLVDCEEKLDLQDEVIFLINKEQKSNLSSIRQFKSSLELLLAVLEKEISDTQKNKIETLEVELAELKQLFKSE
ncbi:hypothetical protein [Bacillus sp. JJ1764]|uniref:hypothetical protein n=1 Tax=Bacillus sp. JJ1764 TaxID=3122964 RepID=UPI002FFE622E